MEIREVFEILSKGIIVSTNSKKYEKAARFLSIDENFEEFDKSVAKIGFYLVGENGYFYLSKPLKRDEEEKFFNSHKDVILAIALLKKLFVHLEASHRIKKSDFIVRIKSKLNEVEDIIKALFKTTDIMEVNDKLFNLLEKNSVLENISGEEYTVLNSVYYYLDIVEGISDE